LRSVIEHDLGAFTSARAELLALSKIGESWSWGQLREWIFKCGDIIGNEFFTAYRWFLTQFEQGDANPESITPEMVCAQRELVAITQDIFNSVFELLPALAMIGQCQNAMVDEAEQEKIDRAASTPEAPYDAVTRQAQLTESWERLCAAQVQFLCVSRGVQDATTEP
jgi:hypothetical protein